MKTPSSLPNFNDLTPQSFPSEFKTLLEGNEAKLKEILLQKNFTWENLLYPLELMDDDLSKTFAKLSHLNSVMNTPELRDAYQACLPMLSAYEASIHHNENLFKAIDTLDAAKLTEAQQKIQQDCVRDFKLSGVNLPKEKQQRLEDINTRLAELSNQFENNIIDAVNAFSLHITDEKRLDGMPEHAILSAKERAEKNGKDGYVLNLEIPCYLAVCTYATDRKLRETMYEAYVTRASELGPHDSKFDNTPLIDEILALRTEKAKLLGFNTYTELSLATKMADSPKAIFNFIDELVAHALPEAKKDVDALQAFAQSEFEIDELEPWDISFISEKRKEALFDINDEMLRPYFPLPHVLQGMFDIIERLYGMSLEEVEVSAWHEDVRCFCLFNSNKKPVGYIYMDLFARPSKRGGAWMDDAQGRHKKLDGDVQLPIAFLTCNFAKSKAYAVPTLSHDEVLTLFHETGHCLHHVLTEVDELSAAGINGVEWDAVELPSQFFENFCWHPEGLAKISSHVETKAALPETLFQSLINSKNFQAGLHLIRQLEYAWFDFLLHDVYPEASDTWVQDAQKTILDAIQVLPRASYNRFAQSFSHLFAGGYAAGYYSYLWAEVLSSDAFSRFEEEGIFNPETGRDFLKHVLSVGSTQSASTFFENFRGRAPSIDAFLQHHGISS